MIVVSDTTILSNLHQADLSFILPALYEQVIIPEAVALELRQLENTLPATLDWLQISRVQNTERVEELLQHLDRGESEAIVLAQELKADWLLIDEQRGRLYARQRSLLGVLLVARRRRLIPSVATAIQKIQQQAGAWYHPQLVQDVLRQANELDT